MPEKDEPKSKTSDPKTEDKPKDALKSEQHAPPPLVAPHHDEPPAPSVPSHPEPARCPHCDGKLKAHPDSGPKAGAVHCDSCGCCLVDGELREGHPPCGVQAG